MKRAMFAFLGVWWSGGCSSAPGDLVIDDFEHGGGNLTAVQPDSSVSLEESGLDGVLGGGRHSALHRTSGTAVDLRINTPPPGLAAFSSGTSQNGAFSLLYGATPLDADLIAGGEIALGVLFDVADFAGPLVLTLSTDGIGSSRATTISPRGLQGSAPDVWIYMPFSSLATNEGAGADLHDVDRILVEFDPPAQGDWGIKEIVTSTLIPEMPSSLLAAVLLGASGACGVLRRRPPGAHAP